LLTKRINRNLVSSTQVIHDTSPLIGNQIRTPSSEINEDELPYYRCYRGSPYKTPSKSPYDQNLGVCCRGWKENASADSEMTATLVTQHLTRGDESSPPFISVTDSPGRVIKLSKSDKIQVNDSVTVFIINREKLRSLGAQCFRSTDIVRNLNIPTYSLKCVKGVQFVTESHWLIYRWIPNECIETIMSFENYRSFLNKRRHRKPYVN
jgi:hypothetical protein